MSDHGPTDLHPDRPDHPRPDGGAPRRPTPDALRTLAVAGAAAVVVAAGVGTAETLAAGLLVMRRAGRDALPAWLWVAAAGRAMLADLIAALVVAIPLSVVLAAILRRRSRGEAAILASWAVPATAVVLVGCVALIDLALLHRLRAPFVLAVVVGLPAIGLAVAYVLGRRAQAAPRSLLRTGIALSAACGLWFVIAVGMMLATPLRGPAVFSLSAPDPTRPDPRAGRRPNILWIVLDTTRADRLSLYGFRQDTTPNLRRLAAESLVFERVIADGMWTVPTHASMFTGLPVRTHGTGHRHLWLDERFATVAQRLAAAGYATCALTNNPLVSDQTGLLRGFASRRVVYHLKNVGRFALASLVERWGLRPPVLLDDDFGAALTNVLATRWIRQTRGPWLMFINLMEAHLPYRVPARWRRRFMDAPQVSRSYALRYRIYGNILESLDLAYNTGQVSVASADQEIFRRQYLAALAYLDMRVGELIDWLAARGELDRTWIIITADHGEYLGDHGLWGHRFLTYQPLLHVPLLIRPPGGDTPRRIRTLVQLSDLYPTVLAMAGLHDDAAASAPATQPAGARGRPRDLLALEDGSERFAVAECNGPAPQTLRRFRDVSDPDIRHRTTAQLAIVRGRYKLIRSADGRRELYDLRADPGERNNLYDAQPQLVSQLEALLAQWEQRTPCYAPSEQKTRKPEVLQSLRGLGYIGSDPNGP